MSAPNIIIPEVKPDEKLQEGARELYRKWRIGKDETIPQFIIRNIRFLHDPKWRERIMSIQSAHDWATTGHWVWKIVAFLFFAAIWGWSGIAFGYVIYRIYLSLT